MKKYESWITLKKYAKMIIYGLGAYTSTFLPVLNQMNQTALVVFITAVLVAFENYYKHRND